MMAVAVEPRCL